MAAALVACAHESATQRAMTLDRQGNDDEALRVLNDELAQHPDDVAARRLAIRLYAVKGDLGSARREVEELEKRLGAGDPRPWIELGHAYELTHDFEAALAAYDKAAEIAPKSPDGPREGGMRCARWGEVEAARPRLEEAVRRGARDAATFHTLGLVDVHLKDLDAAEQAYREGTKVDADAAENWLGLATVAVLRADPKGALDAYDALLAKRPRWAPAEMGRAWALAKLGRKDEAMRALEHALELGAPPDKVARQRAALGL